MRIFAELPLGLIDFALNPLDLNKFILLRVVGINIVAGNHHLCPVLLRQRKHIAQHARLGPVIGIHKIEIFAFRLINSNVSCARRTAVFLMDYANTCIFGGVFIADFPAAVFGSIVDCP